MSCFMQFHKPNLYQTTALWTCSFNVVNRIFQKKHAIVTSSQHSQVSLQQSQENPSHVNQSLSGLKQIGEMVNTARCCNFKTLSPNKLKRYKNGPIAAWRSFQEPTIIPHEGSSTMAPAAWYLRYQVNLYQHRLLNTVVKKILYHSSENHST